MQNSKKIDYTAISDTTLHQAVIGLSEAFPVRYIICWGMTASRQESVGCFAGTPILTRKHFFLLVITHENTRIEHVMQQYIGSKYANEQVDITVVAHGLPNINDAVQQSQRFFTTVCSEGFLLYSHNDLLLPLDFPVIGVEQTLDIAEKIYRHRYRMAEGFILAAKQSIEGGYDTHALFLLHQCAEQACIALIRVFINYRADIHNLSRLLNLCCSFSEKPKNLFERRPEDKVLFDLLQRSYSEARYRDSYQVQNGASESLYTLVDELLLLTKTLCEDKITEYRQALTLETNMTLS